MAELLLWPVLIAGVDKQIDNIYLPCGHFTATLRAIVAAGLETADEPCRIKRGCGH